MAGSEAGHDEVRFGTGFCFLSSLVPEIAALVGGLAAEILAAAFAGELVGDIWRDAADRGLERPLGLVVKMLSDG